jgi:hypothetical protein
LILAPTIAAQPQSVTAARGSNVTFRVSVGGTAPLSYQWYKDGAIVTGANDAALTLNNVQSADAASYMVMVTNVAGSAISQGAVLDVSAESKISFDFSLRFKDKKMASLAAADLNSPTITWNQITAPGYVGYYLYVGIAGVVTNRFDVARTNEVQLSNLMTNQAYYVYVTAYTQSDTESEPSNVLLYELTLGANSSLTTPYVTISKAPGQGVSAVFKVVKSPGISYVIQVSEDLKEWDTVFSIPASQDTEYEFTDTVFTQLPRRFYRAQFDPTGGQAR